jgi:hypothetical protein
LEEFSDLLELAVRFPGFPAQGPAVLTESGAFKALTLDLCEQVGLDLPQIADDNAPVLAQGRRPCTFAAAHGFVADRGGR